MIAHAFPGVRIMTHTSPANADGPGLFHGAFTALVTPFTKDGSTIDLDRLEAQIEFQSQGGVSGIVLCGTTGESPTLTADEFRAVVERGVTAGKQHKLTVIVGTGSNCTAKAIEAHRLAHAAGADASLQVNPYYNKPSQEGLCRHFEAIADSCDLPIMLYNIPGRTGVALNAATIERLGKHAHIQAIKDATGGLELADETRRRTNLAILSGDDPMTLPLMSIGAVGVVSVISNIVPDRVAELCRAALRGDWNEARSIHDELLPLARGLLSLDTNPVPVKTAMRLLNRDNGTVRLPLCEGCDRVEQGVRQLITPLMKQRGPAGPAATRSMSGCVTG
ncbi:MAG: 4-hydroxy-tetrahydrodipicolinate synthase [Phycisphaerales bacterium]|nr:MAG: 4-hydroxy-tetrahydrodipicolinate synthase [Phycisphaerales bacterium]